MDFNLSDDQAMFKDAAARYVRERSNIEDKRKTVKTEQGFSTEHWAQFAEMGWLALMLPERTDGLECSIDDLAVVMQEIGRGVFHEPIVDTAVLCASILADANTSAADSVLSQIGMGEAIVSLSHIDGENHYEYSTDVATTANKTGQGWELNGNKRLAVHAPQATHLIVSANYNNELALFLVEASASGITKNNYHLIDGSHASDINLEGLQLSDDALLLTGDAAVKALHLALDKAIIADCARAVGSMEACMDATAEYLKTRVQYGVHLASFQALQHRMSEMLVELDQGIAILYRALSQFDDKKLRRNAVSGAKVLVSKASRWVTGQCIQLHGGIGVTEEYAVGHHYKAALTFEQRFGDSDWHLDACADALV